MPKVTIDISYATAKRVRKVHDEVSRRQRQGDQTVVVSEVLGLIVDQLPHFYSRGDEVHVDDSESEWTVEEIVDNGQRALCVTYDREQWVVFDIDELLPVDTQGALAGALA